MNCRRVLSRSSHPNQQHPQGGITGDQNPTSHGDRAAGHNVLCRNTLPPRPKSDVCVAVGADTVYSRCLALDRRQYPCLSQQPDWPGRCRPTHHTTDCERWDKIDSRVLKLCLAAPRTPARPASHTRFRACRVQTGKVSHTLVLTLCPRQIWPMRGEGGRSVTARSAE